MRSISISGRTVGDAEPPYIIAELGVNHDGSLDRALRLIEDAAAARADAVKFQYFRADRLMGRASRLAAYQRDAGESDPVEMLRRLELSQDEMSRIVDAAHNAGLHALVTVFSVELVAEAAAIAWDAFKVASPDIINRPLLDRLASVGKPLILSTGAAALDEVRRALAWLRGAHDRLALLHCVSAYPTAPEDASLGGICALRTIFDGPVGYSDHTQLVQTGGLAVALGASILEKHLTYDPDAAGPDHAASLDSTGLALYVTMAQQAGTLIGPPTKTVRRAESDVRHVSRQSITTTRPLPAGHRVGPDDLTIKRPGTGLEPWRLDDVIGRTTAAPIDADEPLRQDHLL